jgi:two-component system, NarL family, sensor histidine kinase DesK
MNVLHSIKKKPRGLPVIPWLLVPLLGLFFLVYPIRLLLASDPTPARVSFALGGAALFAGVFLWLMWTREPLQLVQAEPSEVLKYRAAIAFLAVLAGALSFTFGAEWRMLFFYHINVAAGIMLPKRDAYAVIAGIAILTLVLGFPLGMSWLAFPALAIGLWSTTFVSQVATVAQLRAAREEIARLAVTEERLRFARDLHDLLGHSLSLIILKSELAERLLPDIPENEKAAREVRDLYGVARGALREVREAVSGYRRPSLDEELAGACAMAEAAGISCQTHNEAGVLPHDAEATLTWVVREGVTNVVRHSRAKHCEIRLTRDGDHIHAEVRDDAPGPRVQRGDGEVGGSGLSGLAERVEASGGDFEAGPLAEGGFRLRVSLPLVEGSSREGDQSAERRSPVADGAQVAGEDGGV